MTGIDQESRFLRPPRNDEYPVQHRRCSSYSPLNTFKLPRASDRHYQQQYGDMYFLRLARLKPATERVAKEAWDGFRIAGELARQVDRVLDVRQGELCWVVGTVYMDLPLKPNILDDVAKEHFNSGPPVRRTYVDHTDPTLTQIMLEDESGRLRLTGNILRTTHLVTGVIIAVLGTENSNGDFEIIDTKLPDFPPQPARWELSPTDKLKSLLNHGQDESPEIKSPKKIAFVSGLGITGSSSDLTLELLTDYLLGYSDNLDMENDSSASSICRLIIAGNSLRDPESSTAGQGDDDDRTMKKKQVKKYGYDATSYNASPITHLDSFLAEILPSIPITILPGETDPANIALPQQAIHPAMFPQARAYCSDPQQADTNADPGWFDNVTNPWEGYVEGWRVWGCSGQNVDDILRYLEFSDEDVGLGNDAEADGTRLRVLEALLRWRCAVPTAPDTLWCYPFQNEDPFILRACPHVLFVGNQPKFQTAVVEAESTFRLNGADTEMKDTGGNNACVRLLSLPRFSETGELVLVDAETLEVEVVRFDIFSGKQEKL